MNPKDMTNGIEGVLALIAAIPDNDAAADALLALVLGETGPITAIDAISERVAVLEAALRALETPRFVPLAALVIRKFLAKLEAK